MIQLATIWVTIQSALSAIGEVLGQFVPYVVRTILLLGLLTAVSTLVDWPDITAYLAWVYTVTNMLYLLNPVLDVDTFFALTKIVLGTELIILLIRITFGVFTWVSSGQLPFKQTVEEPSIDTPSGQAPPTSLPF